MAISHADHDHPNTPAARAACRRRMILAATCTCGDPEMGTLIHSRTCPMSPKTEDRKPAKVTVVPRKRGDGGVVRGLKDSKRPNALIKADYDLADVPRMLAYGVRMAWALDLDVKVGDRFNDEEKRLVVAHEVAEIDLVWRDKRADGIWAVFVRNYDSSKTFKVESIQHAFEVAVTRDGWDEYGNLIG